jgi:hypothetical protein
MNTQTLQHRPTTLPLPQVHTHTHSHKHSLSLSQTHTRARTHTHPPTHTHLQTGYQAPQASYTPSQIQSSYGAMAPGSGGGSGGGSVGLLRPSGNPDIERMRAAAANNAGVCVCVCVCVCLSIEEDMRLLVAMECALKDTCGCKHISLP